MASQPAPRRSAFAVYWTALGTYRHLGASQAEDQAIREVAEIYHLTLSEARALLFARVS